MFIVFALKKSLQNITCHVWWGFLPYLAASLIFAENFFRLSWQLILVELIFKDGMYFCVGAASMSVLDLL
jgi:hypothetical protein